MEISEFIWMGINTYIEKYGKKPLCIYLGHKELRQLKAEKTFFTQQTIDYPIHIYGLRIYEVCEDNHFNISE